MSKKTSVKKSPQRKKTVKPNGKAPKRSVLDLKGQMTKIQRELAGLGTAKGKASLFESSVDQLDALASEIADAANQVMTAGEAIQNAADKISAKTEDDAIHSQLNKISASTGDLFEACSVQDITGQRITKITRIIDAIEAGFLSVTQIVGGKGAKAGKVKAIDRMDGSIALEGPQVGGPLVKETEIDKLFD